MKSRLPFLLIGVVLLMLPWQGFAASITFELLATFDYPGSITYTIPNGINDRGDVAGTYLDQSSVYRGFVRFPNGRFSDPIDEPDTMGPTSAQGINRSRTICGNFQAGGTKGYFLTDSIFSEFALSAQHTYIRGLNDTGNFCGNTRGPGQGYVSIGGTVTTFALGERYTSPFGINNLDQVVGTYKHGIRTFGFFRDADGTFTSPITVPAADRTELYGINDIGVMVGLVTISQKTSGILFHGTHHHALYDYPGAVATVFSGINNQGEICGSYYDSKVGQHGFIVRVKLAPGE